LAEERLDRKTVMLRWLRRRHERDDQHLVKRNAPLPDVGTIGELDRLISEAQERDADDDRRLDDFMLGDMPSYERCRANG
jgi:hypothetical protein